MAQIAPFDYGNAIQQGTQNALSTLKARQGVREFNRQGAIRDAYQGGASDEEAANVLRKQGYGQAANALTQQAQQRRGRRLKNEVDAMKFVSAAAPMARDQQSWSRVRQKMIDVAGADPQSLPEEYNPEFVQALAGEAQNKLSGSDLVKVTGPDGEPRFVPASQAPGMQAYEQPEGMSQRDQEVMNLVERGIPYEWAQDVAAGNVSSETDAFGRTILTNRATQERKILGEEQQKGQQGRQSEQQAQTQDPIQPQDEQEQNLFRAVDETGPWAWLRSAGNNVVGPFMEGVPFEETAASKQQIRQFNYAVQQAFKQDDGRMSNYERQIIREFLPDPDRIMTDPDAERTKLREMRTFLERQKEQLQQSMDQTVTQQEKGKLANQIQTVDRVMNLMGTPEGARRQGGPGIRGAAQQQYSADNPATPQTQEDYESLPSGAYFRDDEGLKRKP